MFVGNNSTQHLTNDKSSLVCERLPLWRQADRVYGLGEGHRPVQSEDGNVVVERLGVVVLVHRHRGELVVRRARLALLVKVVLAEPDRDIALLKSKEENTSQ